MSGSNFTDLISRRRQHHDLYCPAMVTDDDLIDPNARPASDAELAACAQNALRVCWKVRQLYQGSQC